jgi:hypothetical protein
MQQEERYAFQDFDMKPQHTRAMRAASPPESSRGSPCTCSRDTTSCAAHAQACPNAKATSAWRRPSQRWRPWYPTTWPARRPANWETTTPGVFEYEVLEPMGAWFADHSQCSRADFCLELDRQFRRFMRAGKSQLAIPMITGGFTKVAIAGHAE